MIMTTTLFPALLAGLLPAMSTSRSIQKKRSYNQMNGVDRRNSMLSRMVCSGEAGPALGKIPEVAIPHVLHNRLPCCY